MPACLLDSAAMIAEHGPPLRVNELVEELMVLANTAVAAQVLAAYPQHALLRSHAAPQAETLAGPRPSIDRTCGGRAACVASR